MINKFVINGRGGSGKDTFIEMFEGKTELYVDNVSSIDPVKAVAKKFGWKGGKSDEERKFLADLKMALIDFNEAPRDHVIKCIEDMEEYEYIFIHIREGSEIQKIKDIYPDVYTILINRNIDLMGNESDDKVYDYEYDMMIDNHGTLEELDESVTTFMKEIDAE